MTEVLYRKWRPRRLDQVVGQEPVTQALRQAVLLGRVAHAYLFCGPRGTGKTSTARILAKAVNCLSPEGGEPDNECIICRSIDEGHALDLIEIDAASNRGIDDIRNLSEKIHYTPNEARSKVYIIDEVHMLTEPAFNALLKTLEEPPPHAMFVLATTEAHKVPLTVISRCQRFDFRRISIEGIVEKLGELCAAEDIEVEDAALALIARAASGSLRDAENLLEQAFVSYGSPVTEENLRDLLELGGDELALELAGHVVRKDLKEGLTLINRVANEGSDLRQLHRGVVDYLRGALLLKTNAGASLGFGKETLSGLKTVADAAAMDHLVHSLKTFAKVDLKRDGSLALPLELALVESSSEIHNDPHPARDVAAGRQSAPPRSPSPPPRQTVDAPEASRPQRPVAAPARTPAPQPAAVAPRPESGAEAQWRELSRALRHVGKKFKLGALMNASREHEISDSVVSIRFSHRSHVERMEQELEDPETRTAVAEASARVLEGAYELRPSLLSTAGNGPEHSAARRSPMVRAAQAMGARILDEKEETDDEPQDASPGAAAAAAHDEGPGGA